MKKVMVLDTNYPAATNLYGDVFVHTRVKEYQKRVTVKVVSFFRDIEDYDYDGVNVEHAPTVADVFDKYDEFRPDAVFIHFYHPALFDFIIKIAVPVKIWVHGYEALGWYRRLFNFSLYGFVRNIHRVAIENFKQMAEVHKIIRKSNADGRIHFIFVSEWMRRVTQTDAAIRAKHSSIIPNPIDTGQFRYQSKTDDHRKKILLIRSFNSKKYANDIAVRAILHLSTRPIFRDLHFTIYGQGKYFRGLTSRLARFDNVNIHETFLPNNIIPNIHLSHGIFLCPTRQDAQGVSMCEAMSSGLVPVTTDCTAIPEFVKHRITGLLGKSSVSMATHIETLYHRPELFHELSRNASNFIHHKCSFANVIAKELSLSNN
jgi:L-malate glycosyltransferase